MIVSFLTSEEGDCGHQLRALRDVDVDHPSAEGKFRAGERTYYCPECDGDLAANTRDELREWVSNRG